MKIIDFFRSRLVLFFTQILLLSLFIYSIGYEFNIDFDTGVSKAQEVIIQFIANYILFDNLEREVYSCLKRSEFNRDGSKNYHPFIDSYQERMNKNKKKVVTLEDFYE